MPTKLVHEAIIATEEIRNKEWVFVRLCTWFKGYSNPTSQTICEDTEYWMVFVHKDKKSTHFDKDRMKHDAYPRR